MNGILGGYEVEKNISIRLKIFDDSSYTSSSLLFDSSNKNSISNPNTSNIFSQKIRFSFHGHVWYLLFTSTKSIGTITNYSKVWMALNGGISLSIMILFLYGTYQHNNESQEDGKRTYKDLSRSETKLRAILENSGDAIGVHLNGIWEMCNSAAARLFGMSSSDELIGSSITNVIAPAERNIILYFVQNRMDGRDVPSAYITRGLKKDGTEFYMEVTRSEFILNNKKNILVILRDITERRTAETALKESEENFQLLLNSVAEGIFGLDLNGNCTFCNKTALEMLRVNEERELIGKNMHEMIHHTYSDGSNFPQNNCKIFQTFQFGQGIHADDEVLWRSDGPSFQAEYWSYPIFRGGVLKGSVVTFFDITQRKLAEQKLEYSLQRLRFHIENAPLATLEFNDEFKIVQWSDKAAKMFG